MRDNRVLTLYIHFQQRVKRDKNVYTVQAYFVVRLPRVAMMGM